MTDTEKRIVGEILQCIIELNTEQRTKIVSTVVGLFGVEAVNAIAEKALAV